jgi:hypothetical protein
MQEEGDPSVKCNPKENIHAFKALFKCDKSNCETIMCRRCMGMQTATG